MDVLVKLLRPNSRLGWLPTFGSSDVQTNAAAAVASLTEHADSRARVAAGDGIKGLVHLLNTGSSEAQSYAAQALGNLAEDTSIAFQVLQRSNWMHQAFVAPHTLCLHQGMNPLHHQRKSLIGGAAWEAISTDLEYGQRKSSTGGAAQKAPSTELGSGCAQVGRAGACAPLVRMLTSASPLSSSVISLQMKAEHEGALAHAANTLAKLSVISSNQVCYRMYLSM